MENLLEMGIYTFEKDEKTGQYFVSEELTGKTFCGSLEEVIRLIELDQKSI